MGEQLVGLILSWAIFYMPIMAVIGLVACAAIWPQARPVCGTSALWGLAAGSGIFVLFFFGAFIWAPESNLAPAMAFFVAPPGFLLGASLGFGYGLVRRGRGAAQ